MEFFVPDSPIILSGSSFIPHPCLPAHPFSLILHPFLSSSFILYPSSFSLTSSDTFARTLVTSALLYANGNVHLGHVAGAYLPADLYTRFLRSSGQDVIHVSGSDEHGAAITIRADDEGITPQEVIDKYHPANEEAFRAFGIEFDIYGRTSWPEHHHVSQEFFLAAYQSGYIVDKEEEQFFDADAGMFLPDRYVEGICPNCGHEGARGDQCDNCSATYNQNELKNPISKLSGKTPELRRTTHLYFQYGEFQQRLVDYVESHAGDWRDHVIGQARSWLKAGLGDAGFASWTAGASWAEAERIIFTRTHEAAKRIDQRCGKALRGLNVRVERGSALAAE